MAGAIPARRRPELAQCSRSRVSRYMLSPASLMGILRFPLPQVTGLPPASPFAVILDCNVETVRLGHRRLTPSSASARALARQATSVSPGAVRKGPPGSRAGRPAPEALRTRGVRILPHLARRIAGGNARHTRGEHRVHHRPASEPERVILKLKLQRAAGCT